MFDLPFRSFFFVLLVFYMYEKIQCFSFDMRPLLFTFTWRQTVQYRINRMEIFISVDFPNLIMYLFFFSFSWYKINSFLFCTNAIGRFRRHAAFFCLWIAWVVHADYVTHTRTYLNHTNPMEFRLKALFCRLWIWKNTITWVCCLTIISKTDRIQLNVQLCVSKNSFFYENIVDKRK